MKFFRSITGFLNNVSKAKDIKNNPNKKAKSKIFAIKSIVTSVIAVIFALLFGWSLKAMGNGDVATLLVWVLVILGAAGAIVLLIESIFFWFLQLSINKNVFTWVSLVVLLSSLCCSIYFAFVYFN